jgi:hypothetical protein
MFMLCNLLFPSNARTPDEQFMRIRAAFFDVLDYFTNGPNSLDVGETNNSSGREIDTMIQRSRISGSLAT